MMKKILNLINTSFLLVSGFIMAQQGVLVTEANSGKSQPDASAQLEVYSENKGVLFPRIPLKSDTDNTTINNPADGIIVFDSAKERNAFWYRDRWYTNYLVEDAKNIIPSTINETAKSTSRVVLNTFPPYEEEFHFNDSTSGWTPVNVSTKFDLTNTQNSIYFIAEGMASINNNPSSTEFGFAVGVFVDGRLVSVRKFFEPAGGTCSWKKFSLSGVLEDLPVGAHTMGVYVRNLPKTSVNYTEVAYGGAASGCYNINATSATIYLTTQISEIRK